MVSEQTETISQTIFSFKCGSTRLTYLAIGYIILLLCYPTISYLIR